MNRRTLNAVEPAVTLAARIGWRLHLSEIVFDDPPYLVLQAIPNFPGCHDKLADLGIVWDVFALIDSVKRAGAHQALTSDCGYAPDSDLQESVLVSHPDDDTIIWELDVRGFRPALAPEFATNDGGYVRLVFARQEYEQDILALLHEMRQSVCTPVATRDLNQDCYNVDHLRATYPHLDRIRIGQLEPDVNGLALERLQELDVNTPWTREPIWPPGTLVEFGFFARGDGHQLIRINGDPLTRTWPGWYFTRWSVLAAFKDWLSHVQRAFTLDRATPLPEGIGKNEFVLRSATEQSLCHDAGKHLAVVMQAGLDEGKTAPGVTVSYCECPLRIVLTPAGPAPA